jgi:hypothetical protein
LGLKLQAVALADGWVNPSLQMMSYDSVMASAALFAGEVRRSILDQ